MRDIIVGILAMLFMLLIDAVILIFGNWDKFINWIESERDNTNKK